MLQITRVDIVDGQTLDIELSNGHLILFDTRHLPKTNHSYDVLRDLEVLPRPGTDGQNIFWRDGPRIALEEILQWLSIQQ
ncbi:hypothetical protein HZF24_05825 [Sedimentibacter hydroxybenzoicus DSM 7310]|uniref:DUF2442 domain-containing protein n=1 Tax=Sedimentibacter hydroxybenzoicus DSM 7310 TaxID=1123245 RepID=A0A974GVU1_SEDHY|nr:hypothetical protein [Sedimentibacter hydroxybenzoicus]NYB73656.1 hypothetical protein [Sedimentibacter hydroxybenzoicus DSM 7310]